MEQTLTQEKLIDRIKKLLALAGSSNENEAQVAMLKAQELMAKHNIEMAEVEDNNTDEKEIVHNGSDIITSAPWKLQMSVIIAENFKCKVYIQKYRGKRAGKVVFLGLKEDTEICSAIYSYVIKVVLKGMDRCYNKVSNYCATSAKGVMGDYTIGFMRGLKEKFDEQKNKNNWGLMLVIDKDVQQAFDDMHTKPSTNKATIKRAYNSDAREMGYTDGKNFSYGTELHE